MTKAGSSNERRWKTKKPRPESLVAPQAVEGLPEATSFSPARLLSSPDFALTNLKLLSISEPQATSLLPFFFSSLSLSLSLPPTRWPFHF